MAKFITAFQQQFIKQYPIDFNATQAYIRAGGTATHPKAAASKLLAKPLVKEAIEKYVQEQLGPLEKDLLGNVRFWIEIRDNKDARPADRLKASEMLAKYRSMFIEKKEITADVAVKIVDDIK